MNPSVEAAEPLPNYKLKVLFENGEQKEFDVGPFLDKGIFVKLKDEEYFSQISIAFGAVQWPNEQDFSNDTLYLLGSSWIFYFHLTPASIAVHVGTKYV